MFALYDIIQTIKSPVKTIGIGAICSAAVLLLACGEKREATENSWLMAHNATTDCEGNILKVRAQFEAFKRYEKLRYDLLAKHTNLTAAQWKKRENSEGEVWLDSKQMLEAGIIDKILINKPVVK